MMDTVTVYLRDGNARIIEHVTHMEIANAGVYVFKHAESSQALPYLSTTYPIGVVEYTESKLEREP